MLNPTGNNGHGRTIFFAATDPNKQLYLPWNEHGIIRTRWIYLNQVPRTSCGCDNKLKADSKPFFATRGDHECIHLVSPFKKYMSSTAGVLQETGTAYNSRAHGFTPGVFCGVLITHLFSVFVLSYFRIKMMFGSSFPQVICMREHALFTLYVFVCA